jgi:hypothetical protein
MPWICCEVNDYISLQTHSLVSIPHPSHKSTAHTHEQTRYNDPNTHKIYIKKELSRDLETSKRTTPTTRPKDEETHRSKMAVLDSTKFATAKALSDQEKTIEALEGRQRALVAELAALTVAETTEAKRAPHECLYVPSLSLFFLVFVYWRRIDGGVSGVVGFRIKLTVYQSLGITMVEEKGAYVRALVCTYFFFGLPHPTLIIIILFVKPIL